MGWFACICLLCTFSAGAIRVNYYGHFLNRMVTVIFFHAFFLEIEDEFKYFSDCLSVVW